MSKNVVLFSVLGADERVLNGLILPDTESQVIFWLKPNKGEDIDHYAQRLSKQIQCEKATFIGLSFGGLMALEVAKHLKPLKIILISSVKKRGEIPWYYRLAGKLRLHRLLPTRRMMRSNSLSHWYFGLKTKEEKALHRSIFEQTDPAFFKWAVNALLTWREPSPNCPLVHIHGAADRLLPLRYVSAHHVLPASGHWMVLQQAPEVSALICRELNTQD